MADRPPTAPAGASPQDKASGRAARPDRPNRAATSVPPPDRHDRRFPFTDLPTWLMLGLVALGLPRTVLADLGIVEPEGSLFYYVLALIPFAAWLAVAILRRSRRPFRDFLVLGVLYGLSLVVVHQLLWTVGPSLGHQPPAAAVDFAEGFAPAFRDLALRAYTIMIALAIGIGTGLVTATVAVLATLARSRRASSPPRS